MPHEPVQLSLQTPPGTAFGLISIEGPNPPFGLVWHIGDTVIDGRGAGVGNFPGRFHIGTFAAPPQLYHLGLWFNSPAGAARAGCACASPPRNGAPKDGIQVLNTGSFPDLKGPLFYLK